MILFLFSESILLPLIVGLVSFRRLGKTYRPFLIMLALGALSEPISYLFIRAMRSNAVPTNLYGLAEWVLIAWQFHIWGLLASKKNLFFGMVGAVAFCWVVENLIFGGITGFPPYFRVLYAFLIVLFSVNKINFMITHDNRKLYADPKFLICIAFIIFFIYKIIYEWAYQTSLFGETEVTITTTRLFSYVNALTNVIFAIALLCIPRPQKFTLK